MVRPREFDRDVALDKAMAVFWAKGFAATSTDDLLAAMGIARQSLYNAFGDKRQLYLEALRAYQQRQITGHLERLNAPASPLDGIRDLLVGVVADDDALRSLGCMGVGAIGEFGTSDPELVEMRDQHGPVLHKRLTARIREGQARGEIDGKLEASTAAGFVQTAMMGLQVVARAGGKARQLHELARFTVERLRAAR
jgi:AcrR family transcriptional regulator